jgi:hypothetical protein
MVLSAQVANATKRRLTGKGASIIKKACATIRNQAIQSGNPRRTLKTPKRTPGEITTTWLRKILPQDTWKCEILQQATTQNGKPTPWKMAIRDYIIKSWDKLWTAYLATIPLETVKSPAQQSTSSYTPKIYFYISKVISILIT